MLQKVSKYSSRWERVKKWAKVGVGEALLDALGDAEGAVCQPPELLTLQEHFRGAQNFSGEKAKKSGVFT